MVMYPSIVLRSELFREKKKKSLDEAVNYACAGISVSIFIFQVHKSVIIYSGNFITFKWLQISKKKKRGREREKIQTFPFWKVTKGREVLGLLQILNSPHLCSTYKMVKRGHWC